MDKPTKTATTPPRKRAADRGVRDAFVMIAMALVVAALGLGLYMQFGLNFWLAVLVALMTYAALLTGHVLVRRGQIVADLEAEIQELRSQLASVQGEAVASSGTAKPQGAGDKAEQKPRDLDDARPAATATPPSVPPSALVESLQSSEARAMASGSPQASPGVGGPPPAPPMPTAAAPKGGSAPMPVGSTAPAQGGSSRPAQMVRPSPTPAAATMTSGPPALPATNTMPPAAPSATVPAWTPPMPAAQAQVAQQAAQQRSITEAVTAMRMPQSGVSPPPLPSAAAPSPQGVTQAASPGPAAPQTSAPTRPMPHAGPQAPVATEASRGEPRAAVPTLPTEPQTSTMSAYWALRPGERPEPELPKPASHAQGSMLPSGSVATADLAPTRVLPSPGPLATSMSTPQLPLPAATAGAGPLVDGDRSAPIVPHEPSGPDLETMQQLIQQLATQLNKPSATAGGEPAAVHRAPPIPSKPAAARDDEAIDHSVAALRQIAGTMQRPAADVVLAPPLPPAPPATVSAANSSSSPAPDVTSAMSREIGDTGPSPYARLAVIAEAVAADRVELFLDPILGLEDRRARHFEVSVRLRDDLGVDIDTDDCASIIAGTGLLARIDAAKLTRTAAVADRLAARGTGASLFANLQAESLADNGFLDTFADTFVDKDPLCARLVLSFAQADVRDFTDVHWEAVSTMAELGFRFALEHVTDLDMDFELLKDSGFSFVKLDSGVFLEGMQAGEQMVPSNDICRHFADLGLGLVVGGIVDEIDLAKIMGFGVLLGQGTLFGAPRSVQVDVKTRSAA